MIEISGLALIISFILLIALNIPIAVAISLSTLVAMLFTISPLSSVTTLAQQMAVGINSFTLLAIPFFILSGLLMRRGGIARRLIDFSIILVGKLPGGLAFVTVIACMLFGAISGSSVAAVSAVGTFLIPEMVKKDMTKILIQHL